MLAIKESSYLLKKLKLTELVFFCQLAKFLLKPPAMVSSIQGYKKYFGIWYEKASPFWLKNPKSYGT